jgi:predicted PurR-regulated permease PerM
MNATARQWRFWGWGFALFILILWALRDMLGPFVAGMAIAYLLDPLVDRLEKHRTPRWLAAGLTLFGFLLLLLLALALLVPLLQAQIIQLIDAIPGWVAWLKTELLPQIEGLLRRLPREEMSRLQEAASAYAGTAVGWTADVLKGLFNQGIALVDIASALLITPIVAFYLLRDWDNLIGHLDRLLPRQHAAIIRQQAKAVDTTLSGFVRGQASVCLCLGAFYAITLSATGLPFAIIVGMTAGLLSFIPFVGSLVGFAASVGIALFQFDEPWRIGVVAGVFVLGQALEGNALTPKLVGDRVGLHPVWIMFALMAGGALFGFVGVLLAVPVAAVIGVLVRFLLSQYRLSQIYQGADFAEAATDAATRQGVPADPLPAPAAPPGDAQGRIAQDSLPPA